MRKQARSMNDDNILKLLDVDKKALLLDVGCDDGEWTMEVANKIGTKQIYGIDVIEETLKEAQRKGVKTKQGDLSNPFPYKDGMFDVVHANMLMEHLSRTEFFVQEVNRVLKKGGYFVAGTDNLASWHNIWSLVFGWMPMSNSNFSQKKMQIGNPLAPNVGKDMERPESWQHIRVLTTTAMKEIFEINGFRLEKSLASGYYPFPSSFARFDKRHGVFMQVKFRKVENV